MDRPSPAENPSRRSVSSELTLYQARGGGPAIPGRDSLSEVGPPGELTPYQARGRWAALTLGWPTQILYLGGLLPDHWPPSCLRAFRGGVKAGLSARAVGALHRAPGRGRLQSALGGTPAYGGRTSRPATAGTPHERRGRQAQQVSSIAPHNRQNENPNPTIEDASSGTPAYGGWTTHVRRTEERPDVPLSYRTSTLRCPCHASGLECRGTIPHSTFPGGGPCPTTPFFTKRPAR